MIVFDQAPQSDIPLRCKIVGVTAETKHQSSPPQEDKHTSSTAPPLKHLTLILQEEIKKAKEEVRLNAISKTAIIKVVHKEVKKLGIHPKEAIATKAVYRGTDGRNFDVCKPFLFGAFGISELDELKEIIPKKKNTMVKHLMNSLSQRYKRLKQITGEFRIQFALPAPEQAPSQTSGRKRKHMELEPETRIPRLECNRTLPENVPWSDIDKVGMEALVSYLVAMVKCTENARFSMKLTKLIVEHLDQEKFKSKKVKLEALGYNMD
nr:hypothetical protein [Tanacetum cinerariifolium]